jgi:sugar (pentulose or hexulose) kinase
VHTRATVAGLAIAGHVGTVFVDDRFASVASPGGWSDSRGLDELTLRMADSIDGYSAITGRPRPTGGAAAAWLDLAREDPRSAARVRHVLQPKDFIIARLTGLAVTDATSAAYTGLSDVRDGCWSVSVAELVDLPVDVLPAQVSATEPVGPLLPEVARRLGLPGDCVAVAGGPDGTVGATMVLAAEKDAVADVSGTTDVLVRRLPSLGAAPAGAVVNPYPLGGWSAGGPTGMTGGALDRWSSLLGFATVADALDHLGNDPIAPPPPGLAVMPSLSGSRFPRWSPDDTGQVVGVRASHEPTDLLRAVVEGCAFVVREGIDALDPERAMTVVLAGGAARSRGLAQLRADVFGRPVKVSTEPDVSLLGAGLLAAVGIWGEGAYDRPPIVSADPIAPDPIRSVAFEERYQRWRELFPAAEGPL